MTASLAEQSNLQQKINAHAPGMSFDQYFYRSRFVYERDLTKIWNKNWLWAGHVSQISSPGDYFLFEFGNESVIIVRDHDQKIHAHANVCRHRGSRVCVAPSGHAGAFSCPYHGWTYQLDGSLRRPRAMADDFDTLPYGLHAVKLIDFCGLIFINLSNEAIDFAPALGKLAPALAPFQINRTKIVHTERYPVAANWKLAVENYLECYHCAPAHKAYAKSHSLQAPAARHPELIASMEKKALAAGLTVDRISVAGLDASPPGTDIYASRYPLYPGYKTGSESGKPVAPLLGDLVDYDGGATDIQIGPVNFFLAYSDYIVGYRFIPRDVQLTDIEVVWLVHEDAKAGSNFDMHELTWLWHITSQDDERIIRHNQQGVNSTHYQPGPLSTMETSISSFQEWYLKMLMP